MLDCPAEAKPPVWPSPIGGGKVVICPFISCAREFAKFSSSCDKEGCCERLVGKKADPSGPSASPGAGSG